MNYAPLPRAPFLPPPPLRRSRPLYVGQLLASGELVTARGLRALEAHADACVRHETEGRTRPRRGGRR